MSDSDDLTELWLIVDSWARYLGENLPDVPCPVRLFRSEAEYQTALDAGEWREGIMVFQVRERSLVKIR